MKFYAVLNSNYDFYSFWSTIRKAKAHAKKIRRDGKEHVVAEYVIDDHGKFMIAREWRV